MNINFNNAKFETSCGRMDQMPECTVPEIVFIGRSNVGKSSLINKVIQRKALARVSSMPGKTATINLFNLDNVRLVDLPGYGYAKVSKSAKFTFSKLITRYLESERDIALVVSLVDIRHKPTKLDVEMIDFLVTHELPFVIAFTKFDKINEKQKNETFDLAREEIEYFDDIIKVVVSSKDGTGIAELQELIMEAAE